jgi:hypothetical protein
VVTGRSEVLESTCVHQHAVDLLAGDVASDHASAL